ncbi:DUF397 domain-containing protein [Streptomyces sp. SID13726]|uniref:DUF397 domain-containing protein n=1 Tax=Streptomyces sp. SID13726 TaxID=2706058 RepID=UPI0013BD4E80|nr:DUF397 domain-containing protein [Streptomyces sp. SID13726]NEB02070.1 DUF397 domain-containing protein [Streptomyces sp. SID13726]
MTELTWHKSSYSDSSGGDCVEVATTSAIHIRDSKTPDAEHLTVSTTTWASFLTHLTR